MVNIDKYRFKMASYPGRGILKEIILNEGIEFVS